MTDVPLTLECPIGGEEWPLTSFRCHCDATKEAQKPGTIHFFCPASHAFTLRRALKRGLFTKEQGEKIVAEAQRVADELRRQEKP